MINKWLVGIAACMALAGCGGVDPDSPLGKRQAAFNEMLKVSENLGGMLRGRLPYDEAKFIAGAVELERLSHEPWQHFPDVRDDERSKANDELWQRQEQFQKMAADLELATAALVARTTEQPLTRSALEPAMRAVEDSCQACHDEFRVY